METLVVSPKQFSVPLAVALMEGIAFSVRVTVIKLSHPAAFGIDAVYVPAVVTAFPSGRT